jgi:hypothetical protein
MAKTVVMILGLVFVLIGVLGFFMESPLFGLFEVDNMHNIVHLVSGVIALAMASMGESSAKTYGKIFGVIYALVTVLGFVMGTDDMLLGIMEINANDNYLHLLLAVILLYVGFSRSSSAPTMGQTM